MSGDVRDEFTNLGTELYVATEGSLTRIVLEANAHGIEAIEIVRR